MDYTYKKINSFVEDVCPFCSKNVCLTSQLTYIETCESL